MSRGGAEREGKRERIPSKLWAVSTEPDAGLQLTRSCPEPKSRVGSVTD